MRNKKYCFVIIVFIIIVLIGGSIYVIHKREKKGGENMEYEMCQVGGLMATIENPKANIRLDYFENLEKNITYDELVKDIGEPTGNRGSGLIRPYYAIEDDIYVIMLFSLNESGKYDYLIGMELYDSEKKLYDMGFD